MSSHWRKLHTTKIGKKKRKRKKKKSPYQVSLDPQQTDTKPNLWMRKISKQSKMNVVNLPPKNEKNYLWVAEIQMPMGVRSVSERVKGSANQCVRRFVAWKIADRSEISKARGSHRRTELKKWKKGVFQIKKSGLGSRKETRTTEA